MSATPDPGLTLERTASYLARLPTKRGWQSRCCDDNDSLRDWTRLHSVLPGLIADPGHLGADVPQPLLRVAVV